MTVTDRGPPRPTRPPPHLSALRGDVRPRDHGEGFGRSCASAAIATTRSAGASSAPRARPCQQLHEDPDRLRSPIDPQGRRPGHRHLGGRVAGTRRSPRSSGASADPRAARPRRGRRSTSATRPPTRWPASSTTASCAKSLGSRNLFSASTVDQMPKHVSSGLLVRRAAADPRARPRPHRLPAHARRQPVGVERQSCAPRPTSPVGSKAIQARGGKVVVVDPRRTRTAEEADEHVAIRPGTDAHLLRRHGQRAVRRRTWSTWVSSPAMSPASTRFAALVAPFTPEAVAADRRRRRRRPSAAWPARSPPRPSAAVYGRIGTHTVEFGTIASWAVDVLNVLTGNLDRPGGAMFPLARPRAAPRNGHGSRLRHGSAPQPGQGLSRGHRRAPGRHPGRRDRDARRGPDPSAGHHRRQPGRCPRPNSRSARRRARLARLHGERRHLPQRDHPPRQRDPAAPVAARAQRVRTWRSTRWPCATSPTGRRRCSSPTAPMEHEISRRLALIAGGQGADADPAVIDDLLIAGALQQAIVGAGLSRRRSRPSRSSRPS